MNNEELFEKNIKLAYKVANKYRNQYLNEMEDIQQIALMGLWKAIINYNGKFQLSTYAWRVINNEILMHLRKDKKTPQTLSLEDLQKEMSNEMEINEVDLIKRLENSFSLKEKNVLKGFIKGETQAQIAKKLNVTQATISRCKTRIKEKIKEEAY